MTVDIPRELVEQFARGNGVIFVGAGLSQGAGLPGWGELLRPLADSLDLPQHLRANPLKVAQYYDNERGRQALVSHIIEQTDTTGTGPTENHRRLLRLGARTWVTTNYDDLIERTFRETGRRFAKVVRDEDLPYTTADAVTLVKLHGDRDQKDTIVITQQDYNTYFRRFPRIKEKLSGLLLEKTFFFVGYSVSDPDFNQIQDEIAFDLEQHQRMAYAVLFDADDFTTSDLRSRNIHVLNIRTGGQKNYSERLGQLLDDLVQQVDQARSQRTQETMRSTIATPSPESEDVCGLLEAMGYRIIDKKPIDGDLYFLCDAKWGAEIRQEVVHFVNRNPTAGDIAALNDAVSTHDAARGTLLTQNPLSASLCDLARQRERVEWYTLDEFTDRLADFRTYLEDLIKEHEASEIPSYYVPLTAESEAGEGRIPEVFKPLTSFVDDWLDKSGCNHLSILGDFGSGKTWFCQRYAYLTAKRYLADPPYNRIPILISLRNYSRAYDVEQLITDAIANRYGIALAAGYKTFARLNESGRLLLIFDGFDEMERRVSDYRTTVENFWELAEVVRPASKVLLTCRTSYFRHQREEETTLIPRRDKVSVAAGDQLIDLGGQNRFEVIYLQEFDDKDIQLALEKRLPAGWKPVYQKIKNLSNLRDLASRPVLLDMIVKTLPQIEDASQINQAALYEAYIDTLLERRWSDETDYISPKDRLFFMQELAWEMYTNRRLTIPFSEFPERVMKHFSLKDDPEQAAFFERDVRTQSYLVRDDAGNYRFAHKSFMEYFVALKMANTITESDLDIPIIEEWKALPLTSEVQGFLLNMMRNPKPLWRLIEATKNKTVAEVGYAGGNAATLLLSQGESFANTELAGTVLKGASLVGANLTGTDLRKSCLREADLSGCILERTDLRNADLMDVHIEEVNAVQTVAWSPDGQLLTSVSQGNKIQVWDSSIWERVMTLKNTGGAITSIGWSSDGNIFVSGDEEGLITVWHPKNWEKLSEFRASPKGIVALDFGSKNHKLLGVAALDRTIGVYDCTTGALLQNLGKLLGGPQVICFSPNEHYLAAADDKGMTRIWKVATGEPIAQLSGSGYPVTSIHFFSESNDLIIFKGNCRVQVWSFTGVLPGRKMDEVSHLWEVYIDEYASVVQSEIEHFVDEYCRENRARFEQEFALELSTKPSKSRLRELRHEFVMRENPVYYDELIEWVEWRHNLLDDSTLAADDKARDLGMTREEMQELRNSIWPKTRYVGFVEKWDIHNENRTLHCWGPQYRGSCLVALPGKTYAIGGFSGRIAIWQGDFTSGGAALEGHLDRVNSLSLNPLSKCIASGSEDGTVRIWDVDPESSTYGQCRKVLRVRMICEGMRISGAKGLDASAPDGAHKLRDWFITRGAME